MRERTLACLLLAAAAFGLPWERCASDCHDRLLPAVAEHDCHDEPCDRHDDEADHERIEFLSVPVTAPPAIVAVPSMQTALHACAPVAPPTRAASLPRPRPPEGEPPTESVVLLI